MFRYRMRLWIYQWSLVLLLVALFITMVANLVGFSQSRNITMGFEFLKSEAGFAISETVPLPVLDMSKGWKALSVYFFESTDSYASALATGALNTIKVATIGIFFSVMFGVGIGLVRSNGSLLSRGLAQAYVRIVRGAPLLLQIVFWYVVCLNVLPGVENGFRFLTHFYLNNRGFSFPYPSWSDSGFSWNVPLLTFNNKNVTEGLTLTPEFLSLTVGLIVYNTAYVAEITRAAIAAVPKGQTEAAAALGIGNLQLIFRILMPQAVNIMKPTLAAQCLNLTKNSSLAVAVGYPDIVAVGGTTMNQTGHTLEVILIWMVFYLGASLLVSRIVNQPSAVVSK